MLFDDAVVEGGARVEKAVLDRRARVCRGSRVGASAAGVEVARVGEDAEVPADGEVAGGRRFPADRG